MRPHAWKGLRAGLVFSFSFLCGSPSWGQVSWEVEHGMGGVHRASALVPIHVRLENPGAQDTEVRLEGFWEEATFRTQSTLELAAGTRKELTFYLGPVGFATNLGVVLRDPSGEVLLESPMTSVRVRDEQPLIGVLGPHPMGLRSDPDAHGGKAGYEGKVVHLKASHLPGSVEGLRSLDVLVWQQPGPGHLNGDQEAAVAQWVLSGGHLVLVASDVGADAAPRVLGRFTQVRPVESLTPHTLPSLAAAAGESLAAFSEPLAVARLLAGEGQVWLEEPWGPLVVDENRGMGSVVVLGFNPTDPRLAGWPGMGRFWHQLLRRKGLTSGGEDSPSQIRSSYGRNRPFDLRRTAAMTLSNDLTEPPPLRKLGLALLLYLLAIGPLDYLVLRRLGRLTWTWMTYPAIVLAFALGAYLLAAASRTDNGKLRYILHRDLLPQASSFTEELHVSLFAAQSGTYRIAPHKTPALPLAHGDRGSELLLGYGYSRFPRPLLTVDPVCEQTRAAVAGRIPKWGFLTATFLGSSAADGAGIEGRLERDGQAMRGFVLPNFGMDFEEGWLVVARGHQGFDYFRLGPLKDGELAAVDAKTQPSVDSWETLVYRQRPAEIKPFIFDLIVETARRLPMEPEWRAAPNPHPHHDWSPLLRSGGVAFVGWADDDEPRAFATGLGGDAIGEVPEGTVVVRALVDHPSPAEVWRRESRRAGHD